MRNERLLWGVERERGRAVEGIFLCLLLACCLSICQSNKGPFHSRKDQIKVLYVILFFD